MSTLINMLPIFISLGLGFALGASNILKPKGFEVNSKLQTIWLILLIFSMGISIGTDTQIIQSITTIGIKALIFAIATITGSVILVFIVSKLFFKEEK